MIKRVFFEFDCLVELPDRLIMSRELVCKLPLISPQILPRCEKTVRELRWYFANLLQGVSLFASGVVHDPEQNAGASSSLASSYAHAHAGAVFGASGSG